MNESRDGLMRQVWITAESTVEVRHVPIPAPAPGEVLVQLAYAGICGSDLHTLRRGHPWLPYPIPPGHEASGVVAAVGATSAALTVGAAADLAIGAPVYLRPAISCGRCFYCRRGRENLCAELIGVGSHRPGAFADYFAVPRAALAPVPAGVSLAAAAMIEPMATAVHAVDIASGGRGRLDGASVAILGAGTIGQCMLLAALGAGAARVVVTDTVAGKRELARQLGAVAALDATDGDLEPAIHAVLDGRPDVVFDCVATAASLATAISLSVRGGSVVVVGVGHGPLEVAIETIQDQEVRIAGSAMYVPADFRAAEELIAAGAAVERLITSVRPVGEAPEALRAAGGVDVKIHLAGPAAS